MDKDELLEEYRKLKEELDKALYKNNKYTVIKVDITYDRFKNNSICITVNKERFNEFIERELEEHIKERGDIDNK